MSKRIPLQIPPGISRPATKYDARGRWFDCNLIRWHERVLRPWGGWEPMLDLSGAPVSLGEPLRSMLAWRSNGNVPHLVLGGPETLAVVAGGVYTDITPDDLTTGAVDAGFDTDADYGDGPYGEGPYGIGTLGLDELIEAQTWQFDTFGEDLVACAKADGRILYWDLSNGGDAAEIHMDAPANCVGVVVTPERFIVALGADGDPRKIAWPDQETTDVWTPEASNQAGDFILQTVGEILAGRRSRNETLIWTTADLWTMRYIGGDLVYSITQLGSKCGTISRQSMAVIDGKAVWMGLGSFFAYDGFVQPIPCEVAEYVFGDMNPVQVSKIVCFPRTRFNEVVWHYPSAGSTENDRYVTLNMLTGEWTIGHLPRTAGEDSDVFPHPLAADPAGNVYAHEVGSRYVDADATEYVPFIESGPIEIVEGERVMSVLAIVPDERTLGGVQAKIYSGDYLTQPETIHGPFPAAAKMDVRITGRTVRLRLEQVEAGWRVGTFRLDVVPSGRR